MSSLLSGDFFTLSLKIKETVYFIHNAMQPDAETTATLGTVFLLLEASSAFCQM